MNPPDWTEVAAQDKALRTEVDTASEALAELRWAHTLAIGVPVAVYARECRVSVHAVRVYAKAHELRTNLAKESSPTDAGTDSQPLSMADALVRVSMTQSRFEVVEAVATARGLAATTVAKDYAQQVRDVLAEATEYAENNGTSVRAEADRIIAYRAAAEPPGSSKGRRGKAAPAGPYAQLEARLGKAMRELQALLVVEVELDGEQKRALVAVLTEVGAMVAAIGDRFAHLSDSEA